MIKAYILTAPNEIQPILNDLYHFIQSKLPLAIEKMSYGMPTFHHKTNIIHFAYFKHHIGIFPGADGMAFIESDLKDYPHSKGGFQVAFNQKMPYDIIEKVIQYRLNSLIKP